MDHNIPIHVNQTLTTMLIVDDIQLVEPTPLEITTDPIDDPQLAGVTFVSPIRVGSPEKCFSSPSSSSSYYSTCCSGSDSESESEKEEG